MDLATGLEVVAIVGLLLLVLADRSRWRVQVAADRSRRMVQVAADRSRRMVQVAAVAAALVVIVLAGGRRVHDVCCVNVAAF